MEQSLDFYGNKNGPWRIWAPEGDYPGIAMSRSIGDSSASKFGVIADPEITECIINNKTKYIICASDGLWEFINNEDAANFANKFYVEKSAQSMAIELNKVAALAWRRDGLACDDITIICAFF